ncbi:DUF4158 domain-containing protein [Streptomyces sp. NPDC054849]
MVSCWTPVGGDWDLVSNKSGPTRLGFVLMLKFFELEGRFPRLVEEFPPTAVDYVAGVVKVPAEDLAKYDLSSGQRRVTVRRSARRSGSVRRPAPMRNGRLLGSPIRSVRWSWWRTGCARLCSCSAASSLRAVSSGSWRRRGRGLSVSSACRPPRACQPCPRQHAAGATDSG